MNLNIPGIAGFQAAEDEARQNSLAGIQQVGGIMGILNAQAGLRKHDREERMADSAEQAFAGLQPELLKNPQALYKLGLQQTAAGNHNLGSTLVNVANHLDTQQQRRDPTQAERALGVIGRLHMQDSAKPGSLTQDQQVELANAVAMVGQARSVLDPVTQQLETIQPLTLPSQYSGLLERYGVKNAKPGNPFPTPAGNGRKQLDSGSEKELQGMNDASTQLFGLAQEFKPNYGGWKLDAAGELAIAAGRRLPESVLKSMGQEGLGDQSAWWQRYYNWENDVRAAKFGLTLTQNELDAFRRATPKPSDTPEQIAKGIGAQLKIISNKQQNRTSGLVAGGYNPDQVRETAGHERTMQQNDEAAIAAVQDASNRGMYATSRGGPQEQQSFPKPSQQAIKRLQMNPSEKAKFEAVFGPGSAAANGIR